MPSTIKSERVPSPVSRPRILTRVTLSILAPDCVRDRAGSHVGGRNGAEQVGGGQRAGLGEILRAQIGDRNAHGRRAMDERARDQHLLGHFLGAACAVWACATCWACAPTA